VWLLQLVFPTVVLAQVFWFRDEDSVGRFGLVLLGLCLLWYAGCFLGLAAPAGRRWIATHCAQLIALYVSLTVSLVGSEAVYRWVRGPNYLQYSPDLGWGLVPGVSDNGEYGWRRPAYPNVKPPGCFRIVCLGDSTTFCRGCSWDKAWPHQLEVFLNQDPDWSRTHGITQVLNLGVSGYGPDQALIALKKFGLAYAPDVVIFHLCVNDFADVSFEYDWGMYTWPGVKRYRPYFILKDGHLLQGRDHVPLPRDGFGNVLDGELQPSFFQLMLLSSLRHQAKSWFDGPPRDDALPLNFGHWPIHDAFREKYLAARPLVWALIKEMSRVSREAGAVFLVSLSPTFMRVAGDDPPWRTASFLHEYKEDTRAAGVPAIDCVHEYFSEGGRDRFLLRNDRWHLNPEGNALIAQTTQRWLREDYPTAKNAWRPSQARLNAKGR